MLASPVHRAIWQRLEQSQELVTGGDAVQHHLDAAVLALPAEEHVLRVVTPGLRELWPVAAPTALLLGATVVCAGWPGFVCLCLGLCGLTGLLHERHARRVILTSHRLLGRRGGAWVVIDRRGSGDADGRGAGAAHTGRRSPDIAE